MTSMKICAVITLQMSLLALQVAINDIESTVNGPYSIRIQSESFEQMTVVI